MGKRSNSYLNKQKNSLKKRLKATIFVCSMTLQMAAYNRRRLRGLLLA
jgi:hypothetical protein